MDNPVGHVRKSFRVVCMPCFGRMDRKVDTMMDMWWTRQVKGLDASPAANDQELVSRCAEWCAGRANSSFACICIASSRTRSAKSAEVSAKRIMNGRLLPDSGRAPGRYHRYRPRTCPQQREPDGTRTHGRACGSQGTGRWPRGLWFLNPSRARFPFAPTDCCRKETGSVSPSRPSSVSRPLWEVSLLSACRVFKE